MRKKKEVQKKISENNISNIFNKLIRQISALYSAKHKCENLCSDEYREQCNHYPDFNKDISHAMASLVNSKEIFYSSNMHIYKAAYIRQIKQLFNRVSEAQGNFSNSKLESISQTIKELHKAETGEKLENSGKNKYISLDLLLKRR